MVLSFLQRKQHFHESKPAYIRSVSTSSIIPPFDAVGIWQHRERKVREGHGISDKIILKNCRECDLETQYLQIRRHWNFWVSFRRDVLKSFFQSMWVFRGSRDKIIGKRGVSCTTTYRYRRSCEIGTEKFSFIHTNSCTFSYNHVLVF
jgi:hypothetical protein